ncbi:MAG: NAD(P)/FAD-dependent oxidoreductase [Candidatus Eremiobacteraeota bacterium]|nr:NAD(P)/FAD-dependent oxidoreductase [Candidatus Eremiobacteraeota bacterium]
MSYDAIVIGAGHNGLTAAAYLARAGLKTLVLERRELVGGAAVSETPWPGWTVSTASYVCSMLHPQIIAELDLAAHGYSAYRKDPSSFTPLPDGRSLLVSSDVAATESEIASFSRRDVAGYRAYSREAERIGDAVFATYLDGAPSLAHFDAATRAVFDGSVADFAERYVETPVLQAMIASDGITGTNRGPRDAGTGYVMAHHLSGHAFDSSGVWGFVRGGMGAISRAIEGAARLAGVEIRTNATVTKIVVANRRASGVVLSDGTQIDARFVLSNAGPKTTYLSLLDAEHVDAALRAKLAGWQTNGPALKLNLALGELPQFTARPARGIAPHHRATIHVAPNIDFMQSAYEDAQRDGASRAPFLECYMQTPTEPEMVPPGKHVLSVFAQYFPYDRADGPWTAGKRADAAATIVDLLADYAPNVPSAIEAQQLLAPPDLEERFGLEGGHIFHGELVPGQIFNDRFAVRGPLAGLYLCGSGTHPGGCVSGAPGKRAAAAALADVRAVAGAPRSV